MITILCYALANSLPIIAIAFSIACYNISLQSIDNITSTALQVYIAIIHVARLLSVPFFFVVAENLPPQI